MYSRSENAATIVRGSTSGSLLEAVLLLAIGFYLRWSGLEGISRSRLYNWSVDVVVWTFLIGGFLILGVMLLCWTNRPWALIVDGLVNLLIGTALVGCGIIWLSHSDIQGILILISGLLVLSAAKGSRANYRLALQARTTLPFAQPPLVKPVEEAVPAVPDLQAKAEATKRLLSTKQARPAVPAKVDIGRKDEPVPDGFLAELGREQESKGE
ncbi:MAG: hypothetical protein ACUVXJ_11250 [Phycisphaerae bacterium]